VVPDVMVYRVTPEFSALPKSESHTTEVKRKKPASTGWGHRISSMALLASSSPNWAGLQGRQGSGHEGQPQGVCVERGHRISGRALLARSSLSQVGPKANKVAGTGPAARCVC
jgi:hypothetical protein